MQLFLISGSTPYGWQSYIENYSSADDWALREYLGSLAAARIKILPEHYV